MTFWNYKNWNSTIDMKITYYHIIYNVCHSNLIQTAMKPDQKIKLFNGDVCMNMPKSVWYNIPKTTSNIIKKIYTHSMQGFSGYNKQSLLPWTMYNYKLLHMF